MKKVRVIIERAKDGFFSAYMPDDNKLSYGVIGEGDTAKAAMDDFVKTYEAMKNMACEKGRPFEEVEFSFSYDVPSFLAYYSDRLSNKGLSVLTGISTAQLSQYTSGYRTPSPKTTKKIEKALHDFGKELSQVQFV